MNIKNMKKSVWKNVFTSWPFAILCLVMSVLLILSICFACFNLVFIKTETGTTTLLTQETEPAKILDKAGIKLTENYTYDVNDTGFYNEISIRLEDDSITALANDADTDTASNVDNYAPNDQQSVTSHYASSAPTSVVVSSAPVSSSPASASQPQISSSSDSFKPVSSSSSSSVSSKEEPSEPELSDNARLSSLKLSKGKLSPSFKKSTYKYTATVDNSVKSIKVTAKAADDNAKIKIKGADSLDVGENTIKVTVTAENGETTKTYRIVVTRKKAESSTSKNETSSKPAESKPDKDNSAESKPESSSSSESKPDKNQLTNYDFDPVSELKAPKIYVDEKGQPLEYIKMYSGKCTAYYNPNNNLTASGRVFKPGHIAVNPKKIPYGTKMYVVSPSGSFVYGYSIAADTGGFVKNGSGTLVDLAFWTKKECTNFGRRTMNVYILEY